MKINARFIGFKRNEKTGAPEVTFEVTHLNDKIAIPFLKEVEINV